ncbi:hypothetical protein ACH4NF_22315 [Streptomyces sp. NPDC017248]|uniref:hypothetical protein n=1 Tax=unclassified Streptomyces TaxID=2593676 RepID=UPI0034405AFB
MSAAHSEVWSGVVLDTDPAVREFERDPAEYMERKATALRSFDFESVRASLSDTGREQRGALLRRVMSFLSPGDKAQKKAG